MYIEAKESFFDEKGEAEWCVTVIACVIRDTLHEEGTLGRSRDEPS